MGNFLWLNSLQLGFVTGPLPESLFALTNVTSFSWAGLLDEESSYPFPVGLCNWDQVQEIAIRGRRGMYGELPKCLTELKSLSQFEMKQTSVSGTIPVGLSRNLQLLDLSLNQLYGCIPFSASPELHTLSLGANSLSCIEDLAGSFPKLEFLLLRGNKLHQFPPLHLMPNLRSLNIGSNQLTGTFPQSISALTKLEDILAGSNLISGEFPDISALKALQTLDLSNNRLARFNSTVHAQIQSLNLESNFLSGTLPFINTTSLKVLDIHNNCLFGKLPLGGEKEASVWKYIDISNNHFEDPDLVDYLLSFKNGFVNASRNRLSGMLEQEPECASLDLSYNNLTGAVDWSLVSKAFNDRGLRYLSLVGNPGLTPSPIPNYIQQLPLLADPNYTCNLLSFFGYSPYFFYDDSLFEYEMCTCNAGSFGVVADGCKTCSIAMPGSIECLGSRSFSIAENFYPYFDTQGRLNTELCLANPDSVVSGFNSCPAHASISASDVALGKSCAQGSSERRCSKCVCEADSKDECYYRSAQRCVKCSRMSLRLSRRAVVISAIVMLVISTIVVSLVMMAVIRRRMRRGDEGQLDGLPIGIFGKLQFVLFGGIPKVLITFIQFSSSLNHWSSTLDAALLKLSNFDASGFGLQCVFREFTQPVALVLLKVLVPIGLLVLVWICIGLAYVFWLLEQKLTNNSDLSAGMLDENEQTEPLKYDSTGDVPAGCESSEKDRMVEEAEVLDRDLDVFPLKSDLAIRSRNVEGVNQFLRLGTSISTSLVNLFYFGISTAIVSALFYERQTNTSNVYMSEFPYIGWNDERALAARVAALIFLVIVPAVPIGACVLLVVFRGRLEDARVKSYVGSLYQSYRGSRYWWELVSLCRKFLIAFVSSLSFRLAIRNWLLISVIGVVHMFQLVLQPWKRRIENLVDSASSILLIICVVANTKNAIGVTGGGTLIMVAWILTWLFIFGAAALWIWKAILEIRSFPRSRDAMALQNNVN